MCFILAPQSERAAILAKVFFLLFAASVLRCFFRPEKKMGPVSWLVVGTCKVEVCVLRHSEEATPGLVEFLRCDGRERSRKKAQL